MYVNQSKLGNDWKQFNKLDDRLVNLKILFSSWMIGIRFMTKLFLEFSWCDIIHN